MVRPLTHMEPGEKATTSFKVITATDIESFANITMNDQPIFLVEAHARGLGWKTRIAPGVLTLSCSVGLMERAGLLEGGMAFLGLNQLRFTNPVYPYDTIHVEVEVVSRRSASREGHPIVTYNWKTVNQRGEIVCQAQSATMFKAEAGDGGKGRSCD